MGVNIYYGVYPKECNDEKIMPYLKKENEIYVSKDDHKEFFEILRKFAEEHIRDDLGLHYFLIDAYGSYMNFINETMKRKKLIKSMDGDYDDRPDFKNDILIIWVM